MKEISIINFVVLQLIAVICLVLIISYLVKLSITNKYNKKFSNFVINDNNNVDHSIEALVNNLFLYIINAISYLLDKLHLFKKSRNQYNKYLFIENYYFKRNIDFISLKVILNIFATLVGLLFLMISYTTYNLIIVLLFIFLVNLVIEIVLKRYYRHYLKELNNEILNLIHIINSNLSVGLSIMQAITNASNKANPLLKKELVLMADDLNNGLSIEKAFNRLNERFNNKEVTYLSTMLAVLNKSGGSIASSFKILESNYEERISYQKSINNNLIFYRWLFIFMGFIPGLLFSIKSIMNHEYFINIFNNIDKIVIFVICLFINIMYYAILLKIMEVDYE